MRRIIPVAILLVFTAALLLAVAIGAGAPNPAAFLNAYNRGQFPLLVGTPTNNVQSLAGGAGALVQEFPSLANSKQNYALVEPNPTAPVAQFDTLQLYSDLYAYYTSIGATTAGLPTIDTTPCPANTFGTCNYQLFTKDYALFVYSAPTAASISVADPFYTRWTAGGALGGSLGVPTSAQTSVTSISKVAGTQQLFAGGIIFSYPAGNSTPSVYAIVAPATAAYNTGGGYATLGFPTGEAFQVDTTGLMRQTFENGRIEWTGTTNPPAVLFPVGEVDITYANQGLALTPGSTANISATTLDNRGLPITGRTLAWATTNGAVVTVAGNGYNAVLTAVGQGSANIYATSEGKTSASLVVTVGSGACCAVGQGAPTAAVTQAFQTAVTRNQLAVTLPAAAPVTRVGNGYVQTFTSADGSGTVYVIAQADGAGTAWLLTGVLYAAYVANGGFTSALGYPVSDPLPGGMQKFAGGAVLAGLPVHVIPAAIAPRWLGLGASTAGAGPPTTDAVVFSSNSGVNGVSQVFANGSIFGLTSGALSGQAFFSGGLILARYLVLAGPAGALGVPISDVYNNGSVQLENFEGGYIDLQPGAAAALEHFNPRVPALTATPATVVPGGKVHLSATGFAPGATLTFTITGQPAFSLKSAAGSFQWDVIVPTSAKPGAVAVQATAQGTTDTASGTYTVALPAALLPGLKLLSGDLQTGLPGSTLAAPVVAVLRDSGGNPIAGASVSATASPGASVTSPVSTDQNGMATVAFRLPPSTGVAVGSISAGGLAVNFSALSVAGTLPNFPAFTRNGQQTASTVSLAAILAFYQNAGALASPDGAATPGLLSQFLTANGGFVLSESGDSVPNPWIAARFANTGISFEAATTDHLRDLVNAGFPVMVNLNLSADGQSSGVTSVVATGVNGDGSIVISDPDPAFARLSLTDYLNGFSQHDHIVTGKLASFVRIALAPVVAGAAPFTIGSQLTAGAAVSSLAGACASVDLGARFQYCDGSQPLYELDLAAANGAAVLDLSGAVVGAPLPLPANAAASWSISRKAGILTALPASLTITGVTDSAAFGPAVSPGALFSIFGTGFAGTPTVTFAGKAVEVLASFPFQINAAMPVSAITGSSALQVTGADGAATAAVTVSGVSPGIFQLGSLGAILNSDATLNTPTNPAQRGQFVSVYCTGLGATSTPKPTLLVNGTTVQTSFAGAVTGFVGLYQINATIPTGLAPSLTGSVAIQQGSSTSKTVPLAIQ